MTRGPQHTVMVLEQHNMFVMVPLASSGKEKTVGFFRSVLPGKTHGSEENIFISSDVVEPRSLTRPSL